MPCPEQVFASIKGCDETFGDEGGHDSEENVERQFPTTGPCVLRYHSEGGAIAPEGIRDGGSGDGTETNEDEVARRKAAQNQLQREEYAGERGIKSAGDTPGCSASNKQLYPVLWQSEPLSYS